MSIIKPFRGLRPLPALASQVASLPYDVMNTAEAREMAKGNPYSFLHVSRAEIDLPAAVDIHSPLVYQRASENFRQLIKDGVLVPDTSDCLYVYAQTMNGRQQIGLVACSSIEDYYGDIIKKHEHTRPEKELDRIAHMEALEAHVGPIFLTYPSHAGIKSIIAQVTATPPAADFVATDEVRHALWVISDTAQIEQLVGYFDREVAHTYIADGHHRAASAAKVGRKKQAANPQHTGTEEYNYFLSVLFPADELAIMDYNRVVGDLNRLTAAEFKTKISEKFSLEPIGRSLSKPSELHHITMYLAEQWYRLIPLAGSYTSDPIGILDVTILQDNLLRPILGIADPRTSTRIDFIGGIRGLAALEQKVDSDEMAVAFALYPVSIQQLIAIADSGEVMPPKSTWFEPKLRDGLVSHLF